MNSHVKIKYQGDHTYVKKKTQKERTKKNF